MEYKDEYDEIYDYSEIDGKEFETSEDDIEEAINAARGTITRGGCPYCHAEDAMKYDGHICYVCSECGWSMHEDLYLRWYLGYGVEMDTE